MSIFLLFPSLFFPNDCNEFIGLNYYVLFFLSPVSWKMCCVFILGLTSVGTFRVCGPWSWSMGSRTEAKTATGLGHRRNLQKTKRITSNRENSCFYVICFHCNVYFCKDKGRFVFKVCWSHCLFPTQKKKETNAEWQSFRWVARQGSVTTKRLETHTLRGGRN